MKKVFFSASMFMWTLTFHATAQYDHYASLFGRQTGGGGTARYASIGGAATTLGADLGAAYVNPAGLGMYRKSEFSFSPNFGFAGSNSSFLDNTGEQERKGSFSFSNLGIAICGLKSDLDKSDWRGGTFSLSMSRTNNFHNRIGFSGLDEHTSMADFFVENANGTSQANLDAQSPYDPYGDGITSLGGLAYWTSMIEPDTNSSSPNQYQNYKEFDIFDKEATYTTKGAQYQWNIAYGANYKDKLYLGGVLGINTINFREDVVYSEYTDGSYNTGGVTNMFDNFTFNDYNKIKGTGVNLKLGYIYKISDVVRIGTTITTPTYYWMNQEYSSDLSVTYPPHLLGGETVSESTTPGYFKFNYTTPLKLAMGTSIFAGKNGFISADLEYIPYQLSDLSGRTSADDRFFRPYNKIISDSYKNVLNLRLGGEARIDIFRLRAGLAYLPNPYSYSDNVNRDIAQISGGVGVRLNDVYFDLGIVNSSYASSYQPYAVYNTYDSFTGQRLTAPTATSKNSLTNIILTLGFYFE